jgi:hypothetical protein
MEFSRELSLRAFSVSCFCIFFTHFSFELALGVNTKVVGMDVSFLIPLVWLLKRIYRTWVIVKLLHVGHSEFLWTFSITFLSLKWKMVLIGTELVLGLNMKVLDNFVSFPVVLFWRENDVWSLSYVENTTRRS